jgi:hypothetical protein
MAAPLWYTYGNVLKGKTTTITSRFMAALVGTAFLLSFLAIPVNAQEDKGGFSLQVSPSPLVATIKPGEKSTLELRIRNTNTKTEDLKMGLRTFSVSDLTGEVNLGSNEPTDAKSFVSFSNPTFTLKAGEWFTQHIIMDTPASAGFTYSFAVTISRQSTTTPTTGAASIQGSVAVFTLLTVDRPGAVRKFEITQVKSAQRVYEYLPATFSVTYKNTGNTLVRPTGNLFIQRLSSDAKPIDALPINASGGYILPGTTRTISIEWKNGFPHYESQEANGQQTAKNLTWNWAHITDLRIGRYVAKVVAIYDDGQRDVPVTGEVAFWVIPWKIILGITLVFVLIIAGIVSLFRGGFKAVKKKSKKKSDEHEKDS